jgi:NADH dehydrogenase
MNRIPRIVIIGAGYGGIVTAIRLQKALNFNEADVTLVNKHDYHFITTHLHMPAAGTDNPENARVDISSLIDEFKIDFIKSIVTQIRPHEKKVILEDGILSYDYLVVGLGGEPETYGITGLKEFSKSIRSINSVRYLYAHIEYHFAKYKIDSDRNDFLTFVVGGAGFTGIEFVGELADSVPSLCKMYDVDPALVQIINIEASANILPGFDRELVEHASNVLTNKGIQFKLSTAIKECRADGVLLANDEFIKTPTVVWTGGVRGNSILEQSGFENIRGRVKVDSYLRAPQFEDIFVIGDCSVFLNEEGKPYPPTAQIATQQAEACAYNLIANIRNTPLKPFVFNNRGVVASLGKGEAVGVVGNKKFKGYFASMIKKIVDIKYLYIIGGISLVLRKGRFL